MTGRRREKGLVRPYVVTDGRAYPTRNTLDLVTLVSGVGDQTPRDLSPERRRILALCRGGALAVIEVAAHLAQPVSVTKVLIADLVDRGHLSTRAPAARLQRHDIRLLEEVLRGLRAL